MKIAIAAALSFAFISASPAAAQADLQRGLRNYQAILKGNKKLDDLSQQEKMEVYRVYRALRKIGVGDSTECSEAKETAKSKSEDLEDSSKKLSACADQDDHRDDCSSEFSRVKSAYSDYEEAVSRLRDACD